MKAVRKITKRNGHKFTSLIPTERPTYAEWAQYIAEQARGREGIEALRTGRQYD
jgi:hypothetical protein